MRLADLVAPETPSDWHDGQLGEDDGAIVDPIEKTEKLMVQ